LRCLLKTIRVEETWTGSLFHIQDAVDEKDFELAIDVLLNGADMLEDIYLGRICSKIQRLLVVQYLESSCSDFKVNFLVNREPVQAGQDWCDVAVPRLVQQLERGCSEPAEGEQDLMKTCLQSENHNSRAENRLLLYYSYCFCCFSGQG
jgi:hypothetical protein